MVALPTLLAALPPVFDNYLQWWIAGAIVVVGLLGLGFRDTTRFSLKRTWAISSVCFDESIRRRVLWITPLAILGVIIVAQLQRPFDEQDAIRQTTKFCLFATGLLVTIAIIILACTNLPREIENRVIYTIVTKPTTRLELIVGKILGFARVSAAILVIMGLFTFGYLHLRAWRLQSYIATRLEAGAVDPASRPTLEHYQQAGLLNAKSFAEPSDLQIYARPPHPGDQWIWMLGNGEQHFVVPFDLKKSDLLPPGIPGAPAGATGLGILVSVDYEARHLTTRESQALPPEPASQPTTLPALGPQLSHPASAPAPAQNPLAPPPIIVQVLDSHLYTLVNPATINQGKPATVPPYDSGRPAEIFITAEGASTLASHLSDDHPTRIYVQVTGTGPGITYKVNNHPVSLYVPGPNGQGRLIQPAPSPNDPQQPSPPVFMGRSGTYGQQVRGGNGADEGDQGATSGANATDTPVAVFRFRTHRAASAVEDGKVRFEFRGGIENTGEGEAEDTGVTDVSLTFYNRQSKKELPAIIVKPENGRTSYVSVPADAVAGGNFDVYARCLTSGDWLGVRDDSLRLVTANQPFALNLLKSLVILWLMSLLVIIASVFCSTFLSWPIAVVLALVILLGHWGVTQLGDSLAPGVGNYVATDFGFRDPSTAKVVSKSVEALSKMLSTVSAILPDISKFSATEDIERGVSITWTTLGDSLAVVLIFGLPMTVLAYLFLKNKEVAP
jgi:ABC-type transport system involved in multi-copper enzyme maturation permease subunit